MVEPWKPGVYECHGEALTVFFGRRKDEIVVYTALFGERDRLPEFDWDSVGCRLLCFTDNSSLSNKYFDIKVVKPSASDPNRAAKIYKILPHKFLNCRYSIWFDGCIAFKKLCPSELVQTYLKESDFAALRHPERDCAYDEAEICKQYNRDNPEVLERQIRDYNAEGLPRNFGLHALGFLIRRDSFRMRRFSRLWWQEIAKHSRRDQVSFAFLRWKYKFPISSIPGSYWDNDLFSYASHSGGELKYW